MPKALVLLTLALLCLAPGLAAAQEDLKMPELGSVAPPISVTKALKGPALTKFQPGKVYVLEFWATWCGPCREAIPHINALSKQFAGKPVEFYSVTHEPAQQLEGFLKRFPIESNILCEGEGLMAAYGIYVIPRTVLIDKQGRVAAITTPELVTEQVLNTLLEGGKISLEVKSSRPASLNWDEDLSANSLVHVVVQPSDSAGDISRTKPGTGRITMDGAVVQRIFQLAADANYFDTQWNVGELDNLRYRVSVKAPNKDDAAARKMLAETIERMFGIHSQWKDVEREVYVLRVAGEVKLEKATGPDQGGFGRHGMVKRPSAAMKDIVEAIRNFGVEKTVIDETGLKDRYILDLQWTPGDLASFMSLMAAKGFSLTKETRSVPTLIVTKS